MKHINTKIMFFLASIIYGEYYKFPNDNFAAISIEFPHDWPVVIDDSYLQAMSGNELIESDLSIAEFYESVYQAVDSVNILIKDMFDEFKIVKKYKLAQAKFNTYKIEALGLDVFGEELNINLVFFSLNLISYV